MVKVNTVSFPATINISAVFPDDFIKDLDSEKATDAIIYFLESIVSNYTVNDIILEELDRLEKLIEKMSFSNDKRIDEIKKRKEFLDRLLSWFENFPQDEVRTVGLDIP